MFEALISEVNQTENYPCITTAKLFLDQIYYCASNDEILNVRNQIDQHVAWKLEGSSA